MALKMYISVNKNNCRAFVVTIYDENKFDYHIINCVII